MSGGYVFCKSCPGLAVGPTCFHKHRHRWAWAQAQAQARACIWCDLNPGVDNNNTSLSQTWQVTIANPLNYLIWLIMFCLKSINYALCILMLWLQLQFNFQVWKYLSLNFSDAGFSILRKTINPKTLHISALCVKNNLHDINTCTYFSFLCLGFLFITLLQISFGHV